VLWLRRHLLGWVSAPVEEHRRDASTSRRLGALAPWAHVAVLERTRLHRTVPDALLAPDEDPNVIWVTGPSKTADVEGILIEGVHGPGEQAVLLV
jgi:L-lactate dehydrogenase complex protein LldG